MYSEWDIVDFGVMVSRRSGNTIPAFRFFLGFIKGRTLHTEKPTNKYYKLGQFSSPKSVVTIVIFGELEVLESIS